jgi:hypothetical protein
LGFFSVCVLTIRVGIGGGCVVGDAMGFVASVAVLSLFIAIGADLAASAIDWDAATLPSSCGRLDTAFLVGEVDSVAFAVTLSVPVDRSGSVELAAAIVFVADVKMTRAKERQSEDLRMDINEFLSALSTCVCIRNLFG